MFIVSDDLQNAINYKALLLKGLSMQEDYKYKNWSPKSGMKDMHDKGYLDGLKAKNSLKMLEDDDSCDYLDDLDFELM